MLKLYRLIPVVFLITFLSAKAQDKAPSKQISSVLRGLGSIQFCPDGKSMALARKKTVLFYLSGGGNSITHKYKTQLSEINDIAFAKDSMLYVAGKRGPLLRNKIYVYNWSFKKKARELAITNSEVIAIEVSHDSKMLSIVQQNGDCKILNSQDGRTKYTLNTNGEKAMDIRFKGNDKELYVITTKSNLFVFNPVDGSQLKKLVIASGNARLRSLSVSNDDKLIAIGADNGNTYIVNTEKSNEITEMKNKQGRIYSLAFSPDDQYLATTSNNRILNIWSMEQNALKKQIKIDSRKGTTTGVNFDPGCKLLYTCNYMDKAVRYYDVSDLNIVAKTLFKNENDKMAPQIIITAPRINEGAAVTNAENINIKGMAIDEGGMFAVFINGTKIKLNNKGEFESNVRLTLGDNLFTIEATDINNNTATKKFIVKRNEMNEDNLNLNFSVKNYLLLIGIDNYKEWPKLTNAVYDAEAIRDVLYSKYGFEKANTIYISNDSAGKQGIIEAFKRVIEKIGPNDNLVIYFSGHGHYDQVLNEGYWIPCDARKGTESDYFANSFLITLIKRLNAKNVFLIADACFSGALFGEASKGEENLTGNKSRWGLTSGRLEYVSDGTLGKHSPFSESLLEVLNSNAKDKISAFEVVQLVKSKVTEKNNQTPIGNPLKNAGDEGGDFYFKQNK